MMPKGSQSYDVEVRCLHQVWPDTNIQWQLDKPSKDLEVSGNSVFFDVDIGEPCNSVRMPRDDVKPRENHITTMKDVTMLQMSPEPCEFSPAGEPFSIV